MTVKKNNSIGKKRKSAFLLYFTFFIDIACMPLYYAFDLGENLIILTFDRIKTAYGS